MIPRRSIVVRGRKLGFHDPQLKRHRIPRSELIAFLVETFGAENLPFPLRALFGSVQINGAYDPGHGSENEKQLRLRQERIARQREVAVERVADLEYQLDAIAGQLDRFVFAATDE